LVNDNFNVVRSDHMHGIATC